MQRYLIFLLVAFAMLSCAKSDAVRPDLSPSDRVGQFFPAGALQLFGGVNPHTDGDVAAVLNGPGGPGPRGTVWRDGNGVRWSVATALLMQEEETRIGCYRFLPEWPDSEDDLAPIRACGFPGYNRFPRVAACYIDPLEADPFVEVAVVLQWRATEDDDWDIVAYLMRFDPQDFLSGDPADPGCVCFTRFSWGRNDVQPDIAYDPETGNLFVVFTHWSTPNSAYVFWRLGQRDRLFGEVVWLTGSAWHAQRDDHNGFHPRIDVGEVTIGQYFGEQLVGIAYTGGTPGPNYNPAINYWPANATGSQTENNLILPDDPDYPGSAAGIPSIDIGPPGTDFAAIAFIQAHTLSWSIRVTASFIDSRSYAFTHLQDPWPDPDHTYLAYPSVAIHDTDWYPFRASVSYVARESTIGYWYPYAHWVNVARNPIPPPHVVTQGDPMLISPTVHGYWDYGVVDESYHGMNTSLVVYDNAYWMVWSSGFDVPNPDRVHGAFGYTE